MTSRDRPRPPKRDLSDLTGRRVGLYCRVSVADRNNPDPREKSTTDQEAVGRRWVTEHGAQLVDVYSDEGISASRFTRKAREHFDRLVADVEAGRLDVIWCWEQSRLSRRPRELHTLLELCRDRDVWWVVKDQAIDLSDFKATLAPGMMSMVDAISSEQTSERVRRGLAESAVAGRPATGRTPYGYHRVYDSETRQFVRQEPQWHDGDDQPVENTAAAIVQEIFRRIAACDSLSRLARDFNERGVVMPNGKAPGRGAQGWYPVKVRQLALNPVYIARRLHQGEILDDVKALWDPLVDEDTFWAVHRILTDPSRRTNRTGRAASLLSGLIECGACGSRMHRRSAKYTCAYCSRVTINREVLDDYVETTLVGWLARPDVFADLTRVDDSAVVVRARADADKARAELDEWRQGLAGGDITLATAMAAEKGFLARIEEAERVAQRSTVPPVLLNQLGPREAAWQRANIDVKRQVIKIVAEITVKPHPVTGGSVGGRRWVDPYVAERVEWRWLIGPEVGEVITALPPKWRLGGADRRMLVTLAGHGGPMARKELASSSMTTTVIERLVARGWVSRDLDHREGGVGRPGHLLAITDAGRQALVDAGVVAS
jgi:site-specific DNA recombinase